MAEKNQQKQIKEREKEYKDREKAKEKVKTAEEKAEDKRLAKQRKENAKYDEKRKKEQGKSEKKSKDKDDDVFDSYYRRAVDMERVAALARPNSRRLRSLWDEKAGYMPKDRRDKLKSALEEDYFLSPEQTEQYFQALAEASRRNALGGGGVMGGAGVMGGGGGVAMGALARKEMAAKQRELQQRQKWLVNFSAQVAYRMCDYIAKGQKELLVSNRLRSIADVVLERVAEILGEPKPARTHPGRLSRFMVAISDRIAVWIENAVYRADALEYEPRESGKDEHIRLDNEEPVIC